MEPPLIEEGAHDNGQEEVYAEQAESHVAEPVTESPIFCSQANFLWTLWISPNTLVSRLLGGASLGLRMRAAF